jgi:hypothetical protein
VKRWSVNGHFSGAKIFTSPGFIFGPFPFWEFGEGTTRNKSIEVRDQLRNYIRLAFLVFSEFQ